MPRVTTWKLPLALFALAFVLKVALSVMIGDTAGRWVAGAFGFLTVVTFGLHVAGRSRPPGSQGRPPTARDQG